MRFYFLLAFSLIFNLSLIAQNDKEKKLGLDCMLLN